MRMREYLFVVLFMHVVFHMQAQTLSGKVSDTEQNKLSWANVAVFDDNGELVTGCTTNEDGTFVLNLPFEIRSCKLITSFVGMKSDTLVVSKFPDNNLDIVLSTEEGMLDDITVTAVRRLFKDRGDMIVADVENTILGRSGTMDKLMNQIPFVSGSGGDFSVFGRGKALLYLNGRKVHSADILNTLSSDRIKTVEVITNPGAKYPADVNAVIKIYTIDNPNGLGGNIFAYAMQGKKFSHVENVSVVYNQNDLQIVGGIMYANLGSEQKAQDYSEVLSYESVSINDVVIDYSGRNMMGNMEVNYTIDEKSSIGLNTQVNWDKTHHDVDLKEVAHYTHGVEDFKSNGINESNNKPLKWLTNAYFNTQFGRSSLELTNDLMINRQSHEFHYNEQSNASVQTRGKMKGLMNSFIADISSSLAENIQLNYGAEITYSQEKQSFDFEQQNIITGLQETGSERRQVLNAEYVNLNYHLGKWNLNAGLRYEYTDLNYYENGVKSESQSRNGNDLFPNMNISFTPTEVMNISLGYRRIISRPMYQQLNDNVQYNARYQYVQGDSHLKPQYTNSIDFLASYKNVRVIGSYELVDGTITIGRSLYGDSQDIILSKTLNLPKYERLQLGVNWWRKIGIYTPYVELNLNKQNFDYAFMGSKRDFGEPSYSFKLHHTFTLPKDFEIQLFVDYNGEYFNAFKRHSEQWSSVLAVSKVLNGGWYVQVSANNLFCSNKSSVTTYCDWIRDATYNENDYQNVQIMVSYDFNYKNKKHNTYTKTSEINRF